MNPTASFHQIKRLEVTGGFLIGLNLIDGFDEEKLRDARERIAGTMRELRANATHVQPLLGEKEGLDAALAQLDAIREKLKGYASMDGQDAEAINRAHLLKALRDR